MTDISETLEMLLVRQGLRAAPAGTGNARGMKRAAGSDERAAPQVALESVSTSDAMRWANDWIDREEDGLADHSPSGGEEDRAVGMPRLRIIRARPFLAVIDGGR